MKVTVVKEKKNDYSGLIYNIAMLLLGIIFLFNPNKILPIIFIVIGVITAIYGINRIFNYYKIKKEFQELYSEYLIIGSFTTIMGILLIILANVLSNAIQIVAGLWIVFIGINKLQLALNFKNNQKIFLTSLLLAIVYLALGLYCIFAQNIIFLYLGVLLIISSVTDIINYIRAK